MSNRLPVLAAEIGELHRRGEASQQAAVTAYREAGERLIEAKALVGRGKWLPWLAEIGISPRTAQGYMQLARLPAEKCAAVAHLGLRAALREISSPRTPHGSSAVAGIEPQPELCRILIRMKNGKEIVLHRTGAELPSDLTFDEWVEGLRIIRDIAFRMPADKAADREERAVTDRMLGEVSRLLVHLDRVPVWSSRHGWSGL